MQIFNRDLVLYLLCSSGEEHNNDYCKVPTHIISREKFRFFNVLESRYSSACLRENACKFLFHFYAYAYVASVPMIAGQRCAMLRNSVYYATKISE
ncbi:hypothetical protein T4D_10732 [Trichinella pseudospiralis]|uniref:Uncharacterized protein n=1 Tax=Trichinella pseudospiralis TaxID=6337 RepID=A0A0V1FMI3_TRIPS|nr:hypothetical protein T4D_10732 [Trichinella pseudospiralis]